MKSKVLFLWVLMGCSIGGFAASTAMAEPVWKELENYSEKDKAYVQQRNPQVADVEKQITELKGKPVNRATSAMLEELEAKRRQLMGELTEHEYKISNDVAGFATTRSKEAEGRLKQLRGEGDPSQPKELVAFEDRVRKERAALDEALKKLPPDAEERKALKEKLGIPNSPSAPAPGPQPEAAPQG